MGGVEGAYLPGASIDEVGYNLDDFDYSLFFSYPAGEIKSNDEQNDENMGGDLDTAFMNALNVSDQTPGTEESSLSQAAEDSPSCSLLLQAREMVTDDQLPQIMNRRAISWSNLKRTFVADIRQSYPLMISNTLNSHDFELVQSFWMKLCGNRPRANFSLCRSGNNREKMGIDFTGLNYGIAYWSSLLQLLPDSVFTLNEVEVYERPQNRGSVVKAKLRVVATKIYEIYASQLAVHYMKNHPRRVNKRHSPPNTTKASMGQAPHGYRSSVAGLDEYPSKRPRTLPSIYKRGFPPTDPLQSYLADLASNGGIISMMKERMREVTQGDLYVFLNDSKEIMSIEVFAAFEHFPLPQPSDNI